MRNKVDMIIYFLLLITFINIILFSKNILKNYYKKIFVINSLKHTKIYSLKKKKYIYLKQICKQKAAIIIMNDMFCLSCRKNLKKTLLKILSKIDCRLYILSSTLNYNFIYRVIKKFNIKYKDFLIDNNNKLLNFFKPQKIPAIVLLDPSLQNLKIIYF